MSKVFITLGRGVEFGINENERFVMRRVVHGWTEQEIDMGPATHKQLFDHVTHMSRLAIHAAKAD